MFHFHHQQLSSMYNLGDLPENAQSHLSQFKNRYLTVGILVTKPVFCCNLILHSDFLLHHIFTIPKLSSTHALFVSLSNTVKLPRILSKSSKPNLHRIYFLPHNDEVQQQQVHHLNPFEPNNKTYIYNTQIIIIIFKTKTNKYPSYPPVFSQVLIAPVR